MTVLLTINGLLLSHEEVGELEQSYGYASGGFATLRMASGRGLRQKAWRKRSTTIQGSGWIPPALSHIDWDMPVTIGCVAAMGLKSATPAIVLPVARRNDVAPYGFAILADGTSVPASASVAGDIMTLATIAGAVQYTGYYYPVLEILSEGPQHSEGAVTATYSWSISGEEV